MAKKSKIDKQEAIDEEFTPNFSQAILDINKINEEPEEVLVATEARKPKDKPKASSGPKKIKKEPVRKIETKQTLKRGISFVINPNLIMEFEELYSKFRIQTQAYFTYSSKAQLFETGCIFLKAHYKRKRKFKNAHEKFVSFIGRKGKRIAGEEYEIRKGNGKIMYLNVDSDIVDTYYDLIFTFMSAKGDIGNESYSTSYFFYDFLQLLKQNFDEFCKYELDNPKD